MGERSQPAAQVEYTPHETRMCPELHAFLRCETVHTERPIAVGFCRLPGRQSPAKGDQAQNGTVFRITAKSVRFADPSTVAVDNNDRGVSLLGQALL